MANKPASRGRSVTTVEELIVRHPAPTLRLRMPRPTQQGNTSETNTSALDHQNDHFSV